MYCPNPTAVCSLSQHTNLPEFQIQCPEPHLGANIHRPKSDNIWHPQIPSPRSPDDWHPHSHSLDLQRKWPSTFESCQFLEGWVQQSERGETLYVCVHIHVLLYNAHSIKLYRTLKRLRFPLSTIESSGCSWLPTIPMASPQKGPRVVMSGWHLETAMFFLCLSWIFPKTCDVKDF